MATQRRKNLGIGLLFVATMSLGALHGTYVDHLQDSDHFCRWLISAATQVRLQGDLDVGPLPEGSPKPMDDELFSEVERIAEDCLPTLEADEADTPGLSKLLRYAIPPKEFMESREREGLLDSDGLPALDSGREDSRLFMPDPREQRARLKTLWAFTRSPEVAAQRRAFLQYLREGKLPSAGTQLGIGDIYASDESTVSLSNVFLGFRKMAANLLWLQADKYWHGGEFHKMLPVMKLTVMLDPNFVDAYIIGAWHLAYNATHDLEDTPLELRRYDPRFGVRVGEKEVYYQQAIAFLLDGTRKNPTNYKLYFDLGFTIFNEKLDDQENAVKYLKKAYEQAHTIWVPRMLYRCMMKNHQYEEALAGYHEFLERHPESPAPTVPYLMRECEAHIPEEKGRKAEANAEAARAKAQKARALAEKYRVEGDGEQAARTTAEAEHMEQEGQAYEEEAERFFAEALEKWKSVFEQDGTGLSESRVIFFEARQKVKEGRYREAIADLDYAKTLTDESFREIADTIIDLKLKYGEALNTSEKRELERRRIAQAVEDRKIDGLVFQFRDDGWYQKQYRAQDKTILHLGSPEISALKERFPHLEEILSLASLNDEYPDLKGTLDLGNTVVFQDGERWYCFVPTSNG